MLFPTIAVLFFVFSLSGGAVITNRNGNLFDEIAPTPEEQLLKEDKDFWDNLGTIHLDKMIKLGEKPNQHVAKNVVVLIGDGMGISTITATRIYKGQRNGKSGEDYNLSYDTFPNVGLVKTYNVDKQVPDSAGTATAIFSGSKARYRAIGVDVRANLVADPAIYEKSKLESVMDWAQRANKDTGIITTTRITHATPAATFAKIHRRGWECDSEIPGNFTFVKDIARQLIEDTPGKNFKVILGGGYQQFGYITRNVTSECARSDGLNLTQKWVDDHQNQKAAFVTNNQQFASVGDVDYLLGLFGPDNLEYDLIRDRSPQGSPSLSEMTLMGLNVLKKNPNGFVLMVEGGRIDHGHHANRPRLALTEAEEFDKTVALVVEQTGPDTLIIVTADHSHAMTINGYSARGNDILGFGSETKDDKPGPTVTYGNGPGFNYHYSPNVTSILGPWIDARNDSNRLNDPKYRHMATWQKSDETHGGEDVGIFATGPGAHLIRGVIEQNYIAHVISYAMCAGPRAEANKHCKDGKSAAAQIAAGTGIILPLLLIQYFFI